MFPRTAHARCQPNDGNFGKFLYRKNLRKIVAEHANVPPHCPRPLPIRRWEFWQIPLRGNLRKMVAEHANVPPHCPRPSPTRRWEFWQIPLRGKAMRPLLGVGHIPQMAFIKQGRLHRIPPRLRSGPLPPPLVVIPKSTPQLPGNPGSPRSPRSGVGCSITLLPRSHQGRHHYRPHFPSFIPSHLPRSSGAIFSMAYRSMTRGTTAACSCRKTRRTSRSRFPASRSIQPTAF